MRLHNKIAFALVAGMLVFSACKKDNPDPNDPNNPNNPNNPPVPTQTDKLTDKAWKVQKTRMKEDGQHDTVDVIIVGAENWRLTFAANRTGTATGTFMATQAAPSPAFTWQFNNDSTYVSLTPTAGGAGLDYLFTATTLTRTVPNLTLSLIDQNGNQVGTVTGTLFETFDRVN